MVAITVILAAVIASFVLGLGPSDAAPTINFDDSYDDGTSPSELTVEVTGGDSVPAGQLSLSNNSDAGSGTAGTYDWTTLGSPSSPDSNVNAGSSATILVGTSNYEVSVIWESEDGGTSQTLTTFEG